MTDITGNNEAINHIVTVDEAAKLMHQTGTKFYAQRTGNGRTIVAFEKDADGIVHDVTEREKTKEEIAEQERVLRHLQMAAVRAANKKEAANA